MQLGEFCDLICSIYLYKLLKLKWGKKEKLKDSVSRDYCYLCVNIIRSYICLGSNHQLRSRGPTMFAIKMQFGTTWLFFKLYSDHRAGVYNCRGTARETYLGNGDLVWRRGSTRYNGFSFFCFFRVFYEEEEEGEVAWR